MTEFDKREEAFEQRFAHDEELKFKATARRNKLLGLWAAEKLGLTGAEADSYALSVVMVELEDSGDHDVAGKIRKDFAAKGVAAVRSSDRPHHDRADGQGRRRHPSRKVAHIMAIPAFSLAKKLHAGETVYSGWCGLPYPLVAETLARDGFAAVTIESQHGLWDVGGILNGIAAVRQGGGAPIVRVPLNDFALVSRALDFGAEGIIAPMINTAADARAFAAAAKFPPIGERSWGPHRAMTLGGVSDMGTYLREANENIITLAMIETRTSLQNFEAIITTPGIDGFFLGPSDLSIALSDGKTVDPLSKEVEGHLDTLIAGAQKAKKIPGAYCHSAERAAALAKRGVRFLAVSSDLSMLRAGAAAALKVLKG